MKIGYIQNFPILKNNFTQNNKITRPSTLGQDIVSFSGKNNSIEAKRIQEIKEAGISNIKNGIKNTDGKNETEKVFNYFGIEFEKDENGNYILDSYKRPEEFDYYGKKQRVGFSDLGIDENSLFENVVEIKNDADFKYTQVTSLGKLEKIGGSAKFTNSKLETLGKLKYIGGNAKFNDTNMKDLGELEYIGGNANFRYTEINSLGKLKTIGKNADFKYAKINSLGELETIGGNADFLWLPIKDLGQLKTIGGDAIFTFCSIKGLGELETIRGNADFRKSNIAALNKLQSIGKNAYIGCSKLTFQDFKNIGVKGRVSVLI